MKIIFLLVIFFSFSIAQIVETGVLIRPIKVGKTIKAEAGLLVNYKPSESKRFYIDVTVNDTTFNELYDFFVIPYNSNFTPSRILIYILDENTSNYAEKIRIKRDIAKNCLALFPDHFLSEDIQAQFCIYSKICKEYPDGVKDSYRNEIKLFSDFISKYPNSKYRDEFEWKIVQMKNYYYEYEGFADMPMSELSSYENFLKDHSNSKIADVIKNKCGKLSRIVYESIIYQQKENKNYQYSFKDAERYKQKAIGYYQDLLSSSDLKMREKARVVLFNIENNRTTYVSPNEW